MVKDAPLAVDVAVTGMRKTRLDHQLLVGGRRLGLGSRSGSSLDILLALKRLQRTIVGLGRDEHVTVTRSREVLSTGLR